MTFFTSSYIFFTVCSVSDSRPTVWVTHTRLRHLADCFLLILMYLFSPVLLLILYKPYSSRNIFM